MPVDTKTCVPGNANLDLKTRMAGKMLGMNMGYQSPRPLTMAPDLSQNGYSPKPDMTPEPRFMKVCAASFDDFVGFNAKPGENGLITKSTVVALPSQNGCGLRMDNPLTFRTLRGDGLSRMAVMKGDLIDLLAVKFNAQEIYNEAYNSIKMAGSADVQRNMIPITRRPTAWDDAYPTHSYDIAQKRIPYTNAAFLTRLDKQELDRAMTAMAQRELQSQATAAPQYEHYNEYTPVTEANQKQSPIGRIPNGEVLSPSHLNPYNGHHNDTGSEFVYSNGYSEAPSEHTINLDINIPGAQQETSSKERRSAHGNHSAKLTKLQNAARSPKVNGYDDTPRGRREARQPVETGSSCAETTPLRQKRKPIDKPQRKSNGTERPAIIEPIPLHSMSETSSLPDKVAPDSHRNAQTALSKEPPAGSSKANGQYLQEVPSRQSTEPYQRQAVTKKEREDVSLNLVRPLTKTRDNPPPTSAGEDNVEPPPLPPARKSTVKQIGVKTKQARGPYEYKSGIPKPVESTTVPNNLRRASPSPAKGYKTGSASPSRSALAVTKHAGWSEESGINLGSSLRGIRDNPEMEYSDQWLQSSLKTDSKPVQSSLPASRESRSRRSSTELEYRSTPTFNLSSSLRKKNEKRSRGLPSRGISPDAYRESIEQSLQRFKTRNLYIDVNTEAMDYEDEYRESTKWNKSIVKKVLIGSNTTVNDSSAASTSEISLGSVVRQSLHKPTDEAGERDVKRRLGESPTNKSRSRSNSMSSEDSVKVSPGRMSISDLEPVMSRGTTTDGSRTRHDSEKSMCEKCGEYLDHPVYHKRYNVHGELVPCKSLTQFTSATSFTRTASDLTTNAGMTSYDDADTTLTFDEDKDINEGTSTEMGDSELTSIGNTTEDLVRSEPDVRQPSRVTDRTAADMSRYGSSPGKYIRDAKPTFIIKPRRCFADEGGSGKFKASFDGEPAPTLEWVRKGIKIEPSDKHKMFMEKDFHYLEISDVTTEDRGQYTCVISNNMGTTRVTAELEVYPARNRPRRLEPVSNLKKSSRSSEKLTRSTEKLPGSTEKLARTSQKFAKSSENLTVGLSLAPAPPIESSVTSRLTVHTTSHSRKDGTLGRERSPRRDKTPPKSPPKSPSTLRDVKSRTSSRRSDTSEDQAEERPSVKAMKTEVRSTNRTPLDFHVETERRSTNQMRAEYNDNEEDMEYIPRDEPRQESQNEARYSQNEARYSQNEVARSQNEATVTSTKTMHVRSTRHIDIHNRMDPTPSDGSEAEKSTSSISINIGGAKSADNESKLSSARHKFESKSRDSASGNTKINVAPVGSKLSSVRDRFEAGTSDSSTLNKAKTYGQVELKKAGIRSGKLASLSQKFSSIENQSTGPILPKPPPQPGTAFSRTKTTQPPNTITIKVPPRAPRPVQEADNKVTSRPVQEADNKVTSRPVQEADNKVTCRPVQEADNKVTSRLVQENTSRAERSFPIERKSPDIPEISISSEVEFKVQIPRNNAAQNQEPEVLPQPEPEVERRKPEIEKPKTTRTASPVSKLSGKSLEIPSNGSNLRRASSKEKVSKVSSKSLDVPNDSSRPSAKDRLSSHSPSRTKASPRASPIPRKDFSPRRDVKSASPARAKQEKTSPPSKITKAASPPAQSAQSAPAPAAKAEAAPARQRATRVTPTVVRGLKDLEVNDGESITLTCSFNGSPSPTITWYFNGALLKDSDEIQQLFDGETAELKFKDVFPDDTGRYEAIATNRIGEAKTSCILTVKDAKPPMTAPSFTKPLQDTVVCDGDSLTFRAHYTGNPEPQMAWFHQGKAVVPSKDFKMSFKEGVALLEIIEVFPEDQGLYELIAKNEKGETKTVCKLTVKEPNEEVGTILQKFSKKAAAADDDKPIFIRTLKNLTVHDGEKVTLQVEVTGDPPIEVCWIHDKEEINPADNSVYQVVANGNQHKLVIPDVLPEDQGRWSCEAYNHFGDAETSCVLTVKEPREDKHLAGQTPAADQHLRDESFDEDVQRDQNILQTRKNKIRNEDTYQGPKFIIKPKSVNTTEGNSARFICEVVGNPQPNVAWFFEGRELLNGGRFKTSRDGWKHIFEISHTLATDAGKYECHATSSQGVEKCTITLVVKRLDSPQSIPDFRTLLKSRPGLGGIGKSAHVESEAEQMDFRGVLTRHVQTKSRPKILQELRDQKVYEGSPVTLQCKVTGTPHPIITWFMGKKEIKESKFFKTSYDQTTAKLEISGAYPEDQGEYYCFAENDAGKVQSKCDIIVLESPQSPSITDQNTSQSTQYIHNMDEEEPPFIEDLQPENVGVLRGDKFKLKAKFVGSEPLTIEWIKGKNTELLPDDRIKIETVRDTTTLTVLKCLSSDTGKYTLCLSNDFGTDSMSASVTVEDKPDAPVGQPVASNIKTNSLTLAWSGPSYDGGSHVTDYRVEMCLNGQTNWKTLTSNCKHTSYNVQGLESNTEYIFRISAANKHGFGPPSNLSDVIVTVVRHFSAFSELEEGDQHSASAEEGGLDPDIMTFTPREVVVTPGRTFKDYYTLGEEIGKGRFGNVHICVEKSTSQQFAAKFIKVKPSQRAEMKQEITIMNRLHHPKLLLLWDAFESPREMTLVMEHVKGGELFERIIDDDYCLTERECVHFMRQICDGIEFMHEQNILHLDLKPENILCITPNSNEIKIIDFGLARQFDPTITTKVLFGTPEFVAPEVINYDQIGYATDMWSVGVICYILVSGLSPFLGDNEQETLANVTMATWDFEDEAFDEISDDAKNFVTQLLIKNMRKRMSVKEALQHKWMSQDVKYMRAKRLSTAKHKRFMARRKWQKTGHAIRALGRMASLQKALSVSRQNSSNGSSTSSMRSRQSSLASDISVTSDRQSVSGDRSSRLSRGSNRVSDSQEESAPEVLDNFTNARSRRFDKDPSLDDAFEKKTSSIKAEADLNSNDLEFDKNNQVNSMTNGYSKTINHDEVSQDADVTPEAETTSPEVTSPEVMSQDESDDNGDPIPDQNEVENFQKTEENSEEIVEDSDAESDGTEVRQECADGSPVFQQDISDFKAYEGDSARFDAQVSGNPEPDVQWLKNSMPIVVNRRKFMMDYGEKGKCSLIIKYCDEDDEATYTCRAMNEHGQATSAAKLTVRTFAQS